MNWQLILSYVGKACLVILPVLVGAGVIGQDVADKISALVAALPSWVADTLTIVTLAGSIYSIRRSKKLNKAPVNLKPT